MAARENKREQLSKKLHLAGVELFLSTAAEIRGKSDDIKALFGVDERTVIWPELPTPGDGYVIKKQQLSRLGLEVIENSDKMAGGLWIRPTLRLRCGGGWAVEGITEAWKFSVTTTYNGKAQDRNGKAAIVTLATDSEPPHLLYTESLAHYTDGNLWDPSPDKAAWNWFGVRGEKWEVHYVDGMCRSRGGDTPSERCFGPDGKVIREFYRDDKGRLHRDPAKGPAVIRYSEDGRPQHVEYYMDGEAVNPGGNKGGAKQRKTPPLSRGRGTGKSGRPARGDKDKEPKI